MLSHLKSKFCANFWGANFASVLLFKWLFASLVSVYIYLHDKLVALQIDHLTTAEEHDGGQRQNIHQAIGKIGCKPEDVFFLFSFDLLWKGLKLILSSSFQYFEFSSENSCRQRSVKLNSSKMELDDFLPSSSTRLNKAFLKFLFYQPKSPHQGTSD